MAASCLRLCFPALLAALQVASSSAISKWPFGHHARDPKCAAGLVGPDSPTCCARSCGVCGGAACQDQPGGADACCAEAIESGGRRCAAVEGPPCVMASSGTVAVNPKRGFVADGAVTCDDPVLLSTSGWYYSYRVEDKYRKEGLQGDCERATKMAKGRFTPMNWCLSSLNADIPDYDRIGHGGSNMFMGFNEPNNRKNCHRDAEEVAKAWSVVMRRWPNSLLVSPATAGDGIQWYDDFFGNCSRLYGKGGCRISFLATHTYSCTPSDTMGYLKKVHERYGYPVWLTEFSCGIHADEKPMSAHVAFMREILPLLDAAPFVHRYAWMSARDSSGFRGLIETGPEGRPRLTELGRIWNSGGGVPAGGKSASWLRYTARVADIVQLDDNLGCSCRPPA